ncbi:MAG TPA: aspartate--ammonia ligase, partial [archaeon]|nr:aspartate--ammonia ligase [archaeon]
IVFNVKGVGRPAEIVQSLAKWKRLALADYGFAHGEGLYTDMNAIRPDETLDNLHSLYVDQWDWERVIRKDERSVEFLKGIVRSIYAAVRDMEREVCAQYPGLAKPYLPEDIFFIHSQDLEDRYPGLSPKERENAICQEKGAVFVIGIGHPLRSGAAHDGRAADYDDWVTQTSAGRGLNGDIVVWYPVLGCAFELSSMGIRVDREALLRQLELTGTTDKKELYFHRRVLNGEAPLSIGGGIGQSRLCMLFLRKAHIGEVQAGVWHEETLALCRTHGIPLL